MRVRLHESEILFKRKLFLFFKRETLSRQPPEEEIAETFFQKIIFENRIN